MSDNLNPQYIVDEKGQRTAVLLTIDEYQRLLQRLEDLEDALELGKAIESEHDFISFKEIREELSDCGLVPDPQSEEN
ncbi:MAG: hypothetical protein IIC24_02820 [Chloroflexi bacterium]|nr:hypothetical protein [Chloroflexota bacterium]